MFEDGEFLRRLDIGTLTLVDIVECGERIGKTIVVLTPDDYDVFENSVLGQAMGHSVFRFDNRGRYCFAGNIKFVCYFSDRATRIIDLRRIG